MPIYIPVYQRRLDPETGEPIYYPNGEQIMDLVDTIVVPDPPIYEMTAEDIAAIEADKAQWANQPQESPTEPDPTQNP